MFTKSRRSIGLLGGTILPTLWFLASLNGSPLPTAKEVDFGRDIYPLLKARCFKCHQGADASSGFRLDLRAEVLGETNGKPLVKPGHSAKSRLIELVSGTAADKKVMPPRGQRLTAPELELLRAWIDQGLKWDDKLLPPSMPSHWAFRPTVSPAIPKVTNVDWVRNPIDAFIAAQHEKRGLTPAPEASRRVLIRRLSLDLTGLPPTPAEIDAFLADKSTNAYEKLVERLLTSPHYGERWARHWLDVARWAESEGYESNHLRPHAWRYRDYVVRSFNSDKPYDLFLREQLAGDEMIPYTDENLIATGFLAAARLSSNEEDRPRQRNDIYVDIVNATNSALLGLTMSCAQCHNHKFDPISARDYYRFQGFFVKGQPANLALRDPALWQAYRAARLPEYEPAKKLQDLLFEGARARLVEQAKKKLSPEARQALDLPEEERNPQQEKLARETEEQLLQFGTGQIENAILPEDAKLYAELKKKVAALAKRMLDPPQTFAFYSPATSPTKVEVLPMKGFYPLTYQPKQLARARPYLLIAGDAHQRGVALDAGWPAIFGPVPKGVTDKTPRLALADWLSSPKNPLTARVYVNRLWQYHFGRGLVATSSDFGIKGTPPTHPELLDWLATELVRSGWSTKHLQRLIVGSSTYRQASANHAGNAKIDPDNTGWWHWQPRRLEAEAIRDSMLAVSGELQRQVGGPSEPADGKSLRRSLYLLQKRENPPPLAGLFDLPAAAAESCTRRHVSTVPLQALYLLNNEFAVHRAKAFAGRVLALAGKDREQQVEKAFLLALGRGPDEAERQAAQRFFKAHTASNSEVAETPPALMDFCQVLFNLNEFVYLE
jgi:hypothetical protein